ncbi:MAG: OmpA family protein [Prevotella sp.]|nr:OmpA family protein [Prevotella sp.]
MNKTLKTLFVAALLTVGMAANAQATYTAADGTTYQFQKHGFLNLEGGAQYTLGETKFKDLISPNVQLGLGYQFSPVFGARIQANGWQSKGGWNAFRIGNEAPHTQVYKWKYVAPGVDLMFNLSNLFAGWNPNRVFNLTLFLGGGANYAWGNEEVNEVAKHLNSNLIALYELENLWNDSKILPFGRGGLELSFRLSDAVRLIIEGNANITTDKYNSKKAENADWYFNALAGLRINLGKGYTAVAPVVAEPEPEPEPVKVVEEKPQPKPQPKPVKVEPLRRDVFFTINSTQIVELEEAKVREIVDYLNKYPNAKVNVTGYADAGTGNDVINDRLAAGRADIVAELLTQKYGIPADRIMKDSKGSRVQPFAENDLNRVTICIAE